jgi:hypothetical protein
LVLIAAAYFGYQKFHTPPSPPPPKPVIAQKPPAAVKPAEVPPPKAPETALGQAVQKARETVAAVESGRTAAANEVMPAEKPPAAEARPAPAPPAPAVPAVVEAPAPRTATPTGPPAPSSQFRTYVDELKIGGFRIGPPARLFVKGILYTQGEVINQDLGVVFAGIDQRTGDLLFKDASGAVVRRRL